MSTCAQCHTEIHPDARFCGSCGASLAVTAAPMSVAAQAAVAISPAVEAGEFPAAPRVRRLVAAAIDVAIGCVFLFALVGIPAWMSPFVRDNFLTKMLRFIPALYLLLRDSIGGRSIGKALMGLVTYDLNLKRPANVVDSVVRNWPLALAAIPVIGWMLCGALSIVIVGQILLGRPQRLGEGFASTQVIDEKLLGGR